MKANPPIEKVLEYGGRHIPYKLMRDDRKRMRIAVEPDLSVRVSVPRRASDRDVEELLGRKARWIARKLDRMEEFHPLPGPLRYVSGETLRFLGRQYRLRVEQGETVPAKLRGKFLYLTVPDKADDKAVKRLVDSWYRQQAERTFKRYFEKCNEVTSRHGLPNASIKLRRMRTRWGSCSNKGNITLNTNLVQAPVHCIEYVIMHELCHLKHHNHSRAYYKLLTQCMPDWKQRRDELRRVILPQ